MIATMQQWRYYDDRPGSTRCCFVLQVMVVFGASSAASEPSSRLAAAYVDVLSSARSMSDGRNNGKWDAMQRELIDASPSTVASIRANRGQQLHRSLFRREEHDTGSLSVYERQQAKEAGGAKRKASAADSTRNTPHESDGSTHSAVDGQSGHSSVIRRRVGLDRKIDGAASSTASIAVANDPADSLSVHGTAVSPQHGRGHHMVSSHHSSTPASNQSTPRRVSRATLPRNDATYASLAEMGLRAAATAWTRAKTRAGSAYSVVGLVVLVIAAFLLYKKFVPQRRTLPSRLNEITAGTHGDENEIWKLSKARTTYRKSVLAANANANGQVTDSEDAAETSPQPRDAVDASSSQGGSSRTALPEDPQEQGRTEKRATSYRDRMKSRAQVS